MSYLAVNVKYTFDSLQSGSPPRRLDLDYAIHVCFANAANQARQRGSGPPAPADPPDQADPAGRADQRGPIRLTKSMIEPQDWMPSLRGGYTTS